MNALANLRLSATELRRWERHAQQLVSEPVTYVVPVIRMSSGNPWALVFTRSRLTMFAVDTELRLPTKPVYSSFPGRDIREVHVDGSTVNFNGYSFLHYDEAGARDTALWISELREHKATLGQGPQTRLTGGSASTPTKNIGDRERLLKRDSSKKSAGLLPRKAALAIVAVGVVALIVASLDSFGLGHDNGGATAQEGNRVAASTTNESVEKDAPAPKTADQLAPSSNRSSSGSMEGAFVQTVTEYGIDVAGYSEAVSAGRQTCEYVSGSTSPADALVAASEILQQSAGYTTSEANDFVGLAVLSFCPEYNEYVSF